MVTLASRHGFCSLRLIRRCHRLQTRGSHLLLPVPI